MSQPSFEILQVNEREFEIVFDCGSVQAALSLRTNGTQVLGSHWIESREGGKQGVSRTTSNHFKGAFTCLAPGGDLLAKISEWVVSALQGEYSRVPIEPAHYISDFQNKTISRLTEMIQQSHALISYKELADQRGIESSPRAVGRALATNPFIFFRPCHWVVPANSPLLDNLRADAAQTSRGIQKGQSRPVGLKRKRAQDIQKIFGGYQGGLELKKILLCSQLPQEFL